MRCGFGRKAVRDADELLHIALSFERARRSQRKSAGPGLLPEMEIITPEELADRLKVKKSWISEKRRPRCAHPLPAVTTRPLRFNWYAIVPWLVEEAKMDAERLKHKRALPVRHRKNRVKVA